MSIVLLRNGLRGTSLRTNSSLYFPRRSRTFGGESLCLMQDVLVTSQPRRKTEEIASAVIQTAMLHAAEWSFQPSADVWRCSMQRCSIPTHCDAPCSGCVVISRKSCCINRQKMCLKLHLNFQISVVVLAAGSVEFPDSGSVEAACDRLQLRSVRNGPSCTWRRPAPQYGEPTTNHIQPRPPSHINEHEVKKLRDSNHFQEPDFWIRTERTGLWIQVVGGVFVSRLRETRR